MLPRDGPATTAPRCRLCYLMSVLLSTTDSWALAHSWEASLCGALSSPASISARCPSVRAVRRAGGFIEGGLWSDYMQQQGYVGP